MPDAALAQFERRWHKPEYRIDLALGEQLDGVRRRCGYPMDIPLGIDPNIGRHDR